MGRSLWGMTPRQSIDAACARLGRDAVVDACVELLRGEDVDPAMVRVLGGPRAEQFLDKPSQAHWLRTFGMRGLLWAWDERALPAVLGGLGDEAWRVREMAAKVVARHLLGDGAEPVAELRQDPVPRVRTEAARALARLTDASA